MSTSGRSNTGGKDGRVKWKDDPGGTGPQIARELQVCGECASARQPMPRA